MVCAHLNGLAAVHHDLLVMGWRRTSASAGLHSASEPHLGLARGERQSRHRQESRGGFMTPMSLGVVTGDVSVAMWRAVRCEGGGCELVPVSMEVYGRLGVPAYALLRRVADVAADVAGARNSRRLSSTARCGT
jgi:hypothetical protein